MNKFKIYENYIILYGVAMEQIDLVSVPKKSFWNLSIPIIAFCIFDAIYGLVDMLWVSQINVEAFFCNWCFNTDNHFDFFTW